MQPTDISSLGKGFSRYFTVAPATTPELEQQVYRIRHEVYCEELGFEARREDRLERDAFDAHSRHCILMTNQTYEPVGCTRLVLANPANPEALLPFERTCSDSLDRSIIDPAKLPRERIAEVSRLAVRAHYRRRRGESTQPVPLDDSDFGTPAQPRFPYIPIGLYLGAIALALRSGVDTIFVLTEPRLAAHFAKLGVEIRQIGRPVEHRGFRVPSVLDVPRVIETMRPITRPIWEIIEKEVNARLDADERRQHLQRG
jgi:N-acyl amino acid synthase of PEP-CTERM/exosortase system